MTPSKKLLIISCSAGNGHVRAAEALYLSCKKLYPHIEVAHIDLASYLNTFSYLHLISSYNFLTKHAPWLYKIMYHVTDSWFTKIFWKVSIPLVPIVRKKFTDYLNNFQPDWIISTHYITQFILPKDINIPVSTVITDYYPHKTWLSASSQNFFVATEEIKNELKKLNLPSVVSGIPIRPDFFIEKNKGELREKYNIPNDWLVILLLPRPHEKIKTKDILSALDNIDPCQNLNIIIINKKNYPVKKVETKIHNLILLKEVTRIDELMSLSDVVITKAGGLTITEAISLQKPLIIIDPIPGQEDYNTTYLEKNNLGKQATSTTEVAQQVQNYLTHPNLLNKISYSDASKIILATVLSQATKP